MPNPEAEICRYAASYIERKGWYQGDSVSPISNAVCLTEALRRSSLNVHRINRAANALAETLQLPFDGTLYGWNDEPERTKEDVIKLLLQTADRLDVS